MPNDIDLILKDQRIAELQSSEKKLTEDCIDLKQRLRHWQRLACDRLNTICALHDEIEELEKGYQELADILLEDERVQPLYPKLTEKVRKRKERKEKDNG